MDTQNVVESTPSLTPEAIIASVGLLVSVPPTLAVLIYWSRRAPWKCCVRVRWRRNPDEENAIYPSPTYRGSNHAVSDGPFELA
ncbi:hypothetical protein QBC44DRAFT_374852 [Cladorrhinum sp. PSN332]|nr:hypothetical protein QBC44DRAFT_374852 [Cladorrhinum sp. PSN332]